MSVDYKDTVFLPKSEFPMRAGLPKREPEILARWQEMRLFDRLRETARGREKFILHDGPPYANGHLHMGHALNKILKDVINRSQQMLGKDAHYVPGWDCHGLPIEWKIEEGYRERGQDKDSVPVVEFRRECREFAKKWVGEQTKEFRRLGVEGDFRRPYTTMSFDAEAQIAREIGKFLMNGGLYRGSKPVLWSVVEKTALADAEVEYHMHTSTMIWVRFPVIAASRPELKGASVVIWTTTPWTIPGNRAVAFDRASAYGVWQVETVTETSAAAAGEKLVVADELAESLRQAVGIEAWQRLGAAEGLADTVLAHPFRGRGYDFPVPILPAGFVTMDQGTGFVHIAPGHGADDFELGLEHGLPMPMTVDGDGRFTAEAPGFTGKTIYTAEGKHGDANPAVIEALEADGALLASGRLKHEYPHSWRSKAPLIFRNTAQWFISMETNDLRKKALEAIEATRFVPAAGKVRLRSMIAQRPDWCVSRQRAWGVPIPVFVHKQSGEPLRDQAVIDRVADAFEAEGADAWYLSDPQRFLGNDYSADDYEQVTDIIEVWFESGSTHAFVLEARPELAWPASLYLEGSDQHRGWFHSSLLEACGTRGRAPYEAVLTHGFMLDEQGRTMSKSQGIGMSPQDIVSESGADIIRLWVVASDYTTDLRFGPEILRHQTDAYRRLRNTLRYLIGNLAGFDEAERVAVEQMPELERWVLHRLWELDEIVRRDCDDFDFHDIYQALHTFCAVDLSAFYFDIRKDSLYCDRPDSAGRRACRTVLDHVFSCLTAWLAPILCFTAEEAWWARGGGPEESVHLRLFPEVPAAWRDPALAEKWAKVREVRRVVTGALEIERAEKRIGSSLQAHPLVHVGSPELRESIDGLDLADIAITSDLTLSDDAPPAEAFTVEEVPGVAVVVGPAGGEKCQRCWKVLPEVGGHDDVPETCDRCADAVRHLAGPGR
ncbi:MAG: isoleucine--tRNA ligase [Rhodospirillales bacterium]|nr:isoleucine--tRNA ligase [Rhodospirillales bacterium]